MACIFLFLSPRSILIFEKIYILLRNLFLNQFRSLPYKVPKVLDLKRLQ
jgi:hypothetical protein